MNIFIEKYATGGTRPLMKPPDGSERIAFCRISDIITCFTHANGSINEHMNETSVLTPSIQRPIDDNHANDLEKKLTTDYQQRNGMFTLNTIVLAYNEETNENLLLDGQHRVCVMRRLVDTFPDIANEVVLVSQKLFKNYEMVNEYWMRINTSKPTVIYKSVLHQELTHVLIKFFKDKFPGYIRKNGRRPNVSIDELECCIAKQTFTPYEKQELCKHMPSAFLSINAYLQSRREDELKSWLAYDAIKMIPKLSAKEGLTWYCGLYDQNHIFDMTFEIILKGKNIEQLNFVQNKRRKISRQLKKDVWSQHNNPNESVGHCYVCSTQITFQEFHVAHVIPRIYKNGVCELWNLKPTCRTCNLRMGTENLNDYKAKHYSNLPTASPVASYVTVPSMSHILKNQPEQ